MKSSVDGRGGEPFLVFLTGLGTARNDLEREAVQSFTELERAEKGFVPGLRFGQAMIDLRNFAASTVRVSHKPDRGWTPKSYKNARFRFHQSWSRN